MNEQLLLLCLLLLIVISQGYQSGFWYGNTRPPDTKYDSVAYANLTLKINRPYQEGPGQHLVTDPERAERTALYVGNSINRQAFDTSFVLDLSYALGISTERVYVLRVDKGTVHYTWESEAVIVNFIFIERNSTTELTLLEAIAELTNQIQIPQSKLFRGTNVTVDIDPTWGLQVITWDVSLKLSYPISAVGGDAVIDGYFLNQGSLGVCDTPLALNYSYYCEFERFFEDDISRVLDISYYRVQTLFIKSAALDSVIVYFRIMPPRPSYPEHNVTAAVADLMLQVNDMDSPLYHGNVTIRTDPTWGVNQFLKRPRSRAALFTLKYYEYDPSRIFNARRQSMITPYDRCKANRRCNWGIQELDQNTNDARFFHRLFERGTLYEVQLFLDFEDWRMGSRGFSWTGAIPPSQIGTSSITKARADSPFIRGAHFWPFDQPSLGPDVPCFLTERNQGLVLDRSLHYAQVTRQEDLIDDLQGRIDWLTANDEFATMNAQLRARKDVKEHTSQVIADYRHWWENEVEELRALNSSQCVGRKCEILFNTSSLELTGAIHARGVAKRSAQGTEVALFTFNSIYLGPELEVKVVGQRALVLLSKTSAVINTTIQALPGTLGGFQGGGSVARLAEDALSDTPRAIFICDLGGYCGTNNNNNTANLNEMTSLISNNVNGPGSANLRVYPFVVRTQAADVREIQTITTSAQLGQTLSGGFVLMFKHFSTPIIPHDVSALQLKSIIEENLNLVSPQSGSIFVERSLSSARPAGVGIVNVTRSAPDSQEGFTWSITFTSSIGDIEQLRAKSFLFGIKARVDINTPRPGNEIRGSFTLSFQNSTTRAIPAAATAEEVAQSLAALPTVRTVFVRRTDPTGNCDDGLCPNGPFAARGLLWMIYVTTLSDNTTPSSPTSPLAQTAEEFFSFSADSSLLQGIDCSISIFAGTSVSPDFPQNLLNVSIPFSLAFGGAGGSFGGRGGRGAGDSLPAAPYGDKFILDLLGGSGGSMGSPDLFAINSALEATTGRGGHGGAAIEIVAANDLTIGSWGQLSARGGDGEQTSQGGGGGGSGGSIVLASGTSIVVQGELDVRGGSGGYGGEDSSLAGGGGGGGRIAIFADSITTSEAKMRVQGGACGVYKTTVSHDVLHLDLQLDFALALSLDPERLAHVIGAHLNLLFPAAIVSFNDTSLALHPAPDTANVFLTTAHVQLTLLDVSSNATQSATTQADSVLRNANGTRIAEVILLHATILRSWNDILLREDAFPTQCNNPGEPGTLYTEALMTTSMYVRETHSAEDTQRGLFLSNRETTNTTSGSAREAPFSANGPIVPFEPARPSRITYYTKTDYVPVESRKTNYGSMFSLISRGESGLNVSNVIGVFFGNTIMHGANFGSAVDEKVFLKRLVTIDPYPVIDRWYKVDIKIQWDAHTYSVALNDTIVAYAQSFKGDDVDGIRLSVTRAVDVWFDEIYVGFDNTMEFVCPISTRTGTSTAAPAQRGWSFEEVHGGNSDGYTEYNVMTRHYNFLDTLGSIPFDGQGAVKDFQDIKGQHADGDYPITQGKIHAGALVYLTNSSRTIQDPLQASAIQDSPVGLWSTGATANNLGDGRHFWYTEYNYVSPQAPELNGGVAACSSQDLITWRFEGIVFHYANLSDQVFGSEGPFTVERPKVLFNAPTKEYVMWAVMDHKYNRSLAMSAIASSPFEDGPFLFRRALYPDGNQTRDQVIFVNNELIPVLARTYYQTVEFVLPEAMMQPVWESAKSSSGVINFRSNYHRAYYDIGYDNFNDIYNQRWRKEDIEYKVICRDKISGVEREVKSGTYNKEGFICNDPQEEKIVYGQGNPIITSRFVSPNASENSWWRPTSVPAVEAQAWSANYRDGYCGIRKLNDDFDLNDPNLAKFMPQIRDTCSNIADNPVHQALPDKLIGVLKVILTRRAKFIAFSQLTEDYLDTTGVLSSYEGEFEAGNLISLLTELGQFGFGVGVSINSTFSPPRRSEYDTAVDYRIRFSQYVLNYNDRATYSLACVLDGVCPVNFKDQLTAGQY